MKQQDMLFGYVIWAARTQLVNESVKNGVISGAAKYKNPEAHRHQVKGTEHRRA